MVVDMATLFARGVGEFIGVKFLGQPQTLRQ